MCVSRNIVTEISTIISYSHCCSVVENFKRLSLSLLILCKLQLTAISGIKMHYNFYVLEHLRHAVILGMDFLEQHKVQIDLHSKTVYIQEKLLCVSCCLCLYFGSSIMLGTYFVNFSKKISNDQELIQSDPISCPQNQKGNN